MAAWRGAYAALAALLLPGWALALDLPEGARQVHAQNTDDVLFHVPVAAFSDGNLPVTTGEGTETTHVWQIPNMSLSTNQLAAFLRGQLENDDFEIILDCRDNFCGGFDFRYALSIADEPLMHVDLGDYRFISAEKTLGDESRFFALMISKSPSTGFVQITESIEGTNDVPIITLSTRSRSDTPLSLPQSDLSDDLLNVGFAILSDVEFKTGSSTISDKNAHSIQSLAAFLLANPDRTVALVGHTDAVGSLSANVALSRERAASVLQLLVSEFNVPAAQLEADGVGYLSPRANNLTADGRTENRRVEVIMTSTR